jgi:hypothetical protein
MMGRQKKLFSANKKPTPSQEEKKHVNELLDEALEETFPASDPPAILEPAPDSPPADVKAPRTARTLRQTIARGRS